MADGTDIGYLREALDGACKNRHERVNREVLHVKDEQRRQRADINSLRERMASSFGTEGGDGGTVGRLQERVKTVEDAQAAHRDDIAGLKQIYFKILLTCATSTVVANVLLRLAEHLMAQGG